MAIDNRPEKISAIFDDEDDELLDGLFGIDRDANSLIQVGAIFNPLIAVYSAWKSIFDSAETKHRVKTAIRALCDELESLRSSFPVGIENSFKQDWFKRAVSVLIEEAYKAVNEKKAVTLARALAYGCFPNDENKHRQEDLASYIHDLSQLGEDDLQMLKLLREVYQEPIKITPNMHDPNYFTQHFAEFKTAAQKLKIHPDDCVSLGARLSGFGLAYETPPNNTITGHEPCFRPTRRGVYLLSLLEAAEMSHEKQN